MTKIFGHRGASGYAPENTLPAFALARKQGADGVELDVQLTKDGEVVVIHDETVDRVTDGTGFVKDYTLEDLRKLSAHNHMEEYQGTQIPLLKEVLALLEDSKMKVNIELKTGIFWYPDIEEKTLAIVKEAGMEDRVIYSSFNHYSIQKIKKLDIMAEVAYLYSDIILDVESYAESTGVYALHPAIYHLKMSNFLEQYQKKGMKVRVWTVNDVDDMKEFMEKKVDAIITNYPNTALQIRDEL